MSIASRIEQIEQHLTDDYSVLELAGADLTNVDKNIENLKQSWEERLLYFLANGTDVVWNNWLPKVTGSGETITLNNTIEAKMNIVYKGNTSQTGTPTPDTPIPVQVVSGDNTIDICGKNLLPVTNQDLATNGVSFKAQNGKIIINGTATSNISGANLKNDNSFPITLKAGTYYFKRTSNDISTGLIDDNNNTIVSLQSGTDTYEQSFTLSSDKKLYLFFFIASGRTITNYEYELMISNTATTYEPYQSQSYPINIGNIELCKIGDYQDKIAKSTGKNLFDISTITENTYIDENGNTGSSQVTNLSDYIKLKPNTSYTLSYDYSTLLNSNQRNFAYYDENKTYISGQTYFPTNKANTITTPNNTKYIRFSYDKNCYSIMLNEGTTALPYEPYGKVWYLNKQIGKVVLDGSELWDYYTSTSKPVFFIVTENFGIYYKQEANLSCYCDYYKGKGQVASFDDVYNLGNNVIAFRTAYTRLVIRDDRFNNTEDFKAELSTHNTIVYYVLATPTNEEITDTTLISQLEALKKSYNNQTNISQENSKEAFILDVTALGN